MSEESRSVLKEFTKTPEMTLAWGFRLLLWATITASGIIGKIAWARLDSISDDLKVGVAQFQSLNTTVQTTIAKYDSLRELRDNEIKGITAEVNDHENRIRVLEKR